MKLTVMPVGMLGTNCYLLASEAKNCFIIDPGAQPEKIADALAEKGLTPQAILLTHGHHDHIGGCKKLMELYPAIPLYLSANDEELLTDEKKSQAIMRGLDSGPWPVERFKHIADGAVLVLDELEVKAVETPGHTKGGITYLCGDWMFSGDTLFKGDVGRTDLYGGDYPTLKASLKKLADLPGDYVVYPGHGPDSTLADERAHNRYINE